MISELNSFEYWFLNYVPSVLSEEKVAIALIAFDSAKQTYTMSIASDWRKRVLALDEGSDLELLGMSLKDVRSRLAADPVMTMNQLEDSFSNTIQISERQTAEVDLTLSTVENLAAEILRRANADSKQQRVLRFNSRQETVRV